MNYRHSGKSCYTRDVLGNLMSGAQEYYDGLVAQGYGLEQAKSFTQQHFPGFSPSAPMPAPPITSAPTVTIVLKAPSTLNWVAMGLTAVAITLIFIAMFSNSWMTGEDNDVTISFGFSEWGVDDDGDIDTRDIEECKADECDDVSAAGTTGFRFLLIGAIIAIVSLIFIGMNSFGVYQSKFGMIAAFASGVLAIVGSIVWLIMFPEIIELDDLSPGIAFYLAIIGGSLCIGAGACEIKS